MDTLLKNGVVDADAHVIETQATWDYLEPSESKYRPVITPAGPGVPREGWMINGDLAPALLRRFQDDEIVKMSEIAGRNMSTPKAAREMTDIGLRLQHMDELGIDIQVIFPTMWLQTLTTDPDAEAALAKSYNRWLSEIYASGKGRLRWACIAPTLIIEEAIKETRQAKENGAVAVFMRAFEGDRVMTDPYFYPLYEEAQRLDMPITVHIGNGNRHNCDLFGQSPITISAKGFAVTRVPAVVGCMWLLMSEIPEKFPNLRWGFIESAAQWMPWIYNEVVRRYESVGKEVPDNLFGDSNIYATCQNDDELSWIFRYAGDDSLVIGTDYGHTDPSAEIDAISIFRSRQDIEESDKRRILHDNPRRLYSI